MNDIPFNRLGFSGDEYKYIQDAVERGHLAGDGHYTYLCEKFLGNVTQTNSCLLTTSCTHALEMSAILLDIGPGDEVILPSFTFVSTANAYALRGASIRFVDVSSDTFNVDASLVENSLSERTKALVAVHYAGVACQMDRLVSACEENGTCLVEDNAHGLFGEYKGRPLGSFGALSTLSFHETKNVACGEGGALLINDEEFVRRAEIIREKGTNRKQFFRGDVDKYTWMDIGSSYVQSEILAAVLWAQLLRSEDTQKSRHAIWNSYYSTLREWAVSAGVILPSIPAYSRHPAHLFYMLMPDNNSRDRFLQHSGKSNILSVFHYVPLHLSPMGARFGYKKGDLPVTEDVSERLVRLPLYPGMTGDDIQRVIEMVTSFQP